MKIIMIFLKIVFLLVGISILAILGFTGYKIYTGILETLQK